MRDRKGALYDFGDVSQSKSAHKKQLESEISNLLFNSVSELLNEDDYESLKTSILDSINKYISNIH